MQTAQVSLLSSIDSLSTMGLVEITRTLPTHLQLLREIRRRFFAGHYELVILIDYPGFHFRLAACAAKADIPVLYYVAPQLWAWGEWRIKALRRNVGSLAVVLPFEERFFRDHGVAAEFVGHPLLDQVTPAARTSARDELGLDHESPVLGLFPGSRVQEVTRLWPLFREAATRVRRAIPNLQIIVAAGPHGDRVTDFIVWRGDARTILHASDAAICKSGTITLEAALAGTPMVIAYRMHPLTFAIAKRAVHVPHVGLVNLVAEREVAPEYLQNHATPEALAAATQTLLCRDSMPATHQRAAFANVRSRLGSPGAARRVADIAARLVA